VGLAFVAPLLGSVFFMLVVGLLVDILQVNPERAEEGKVVFLVVPQLPVKQTQEVVAVEMVITLLLSPVVPASLSFVTPQILTPLHH
jgi:hypothetical protein